MKKELSKFRILETVAVLALFFFILHLIFEIKYLDIIAVVLLAIGLFVKSIAGLIARAWLKFAEIIGKVNSVILLGFVFYILLTPLALLYRLFNRNPLNLKKDFVSKDSYFYTRDQTYTAKDIASPW